MPDSGRNNGTPAADADEYRFLGIAKRYPVRDLSPVNQNFSLIWKGRAEKSFCFHRDVCIF